MIRTARHTVIPDIMQIRVRAPAAAGPAGPWWLSGGVAAANCMAAYTPKGAASLAASYDNNAAPGNGLPDGTYDAAPGVAPTWAGATGWTFNGTTQWLSTGVTVNQTYSAIVRYQATLTGTLAYIIGALTGVSNYFGFIVTNIRHYYIFFSVNLIDAAVPSAVLAMTPAGGYLNGALEVAFVPPSDSVANVNIGRRSDGFWYYTGNVLALAFYNTTLTPAQVLAITNAMNAL